jgi:hypothetical protein
VLKTVFAILGAIIENAVIAMTRPAAGQNTQGASKRVALGGSGALGGEGRADSVLTSRSDRRGLKLKPKLWEPQLYVDLPVCASNLAI